MFCPKCGSILMPKTKGGKTIMACACGYTDDNGDAAVIKEEMERTEVEVVDKDETDTLPLTEAECPKCGHQKAYYWLQQTRASDEPETKFLKCEECKHTWRDYD